MNHETAVHVNLSERSYGIAIGSGNLKEVGQFVSGLGEITHAVVITDTNVQGSHGGRCVDSLVEAGIRPATEEQS